MEHDRDNVLRRTCLHTVTATFLVYSLIKCNAGVSNFCLKEEEAEFVKTLPIFHRNIGGVADIIIKIKYLKYCAQEVCCLLNDFTSFHYVCVDDQWSNCVIAGPYDIPISELNSH